MTRETFQPGAKIFAFAVRFSCCKAIQVRNAKSAPKVATGGKFSGSRGADHGAGTRAAFAVVETLITTVVGVPLLTTTGDVGAAQVAFAGAPVQVRVTFMELVVPAARANWREKFAGIPAFTVAEVDPAEAGATVKSGFTVSLTAAEVLVLKFVSPE
jgi:hypothetical protein